MRIHPAHHDSDTLVAPGMRGLEHGIGLTDTRRGAKEDLEFPAGLLGLFLLDTGEEGVGVRSPIVLRRRKPHCTLPSRARFKASTFTRGSPNSPKGRPAVCWATTWRTASS